MAMINCRECGARISSSATACPSCGKPQPKRTSATTWVVTGVLALVVVSCVSSMNRRDKQKFDVPPPVAAAEKAARAIENAKRDEQLNRASLGAYSLRGAAKVPSSFVVTSAEVQSDGTVCYEYESKNSFNAQLRGRAVLEKGASGLLSQESHGNQFLSAWNKRCLSSGTDYARDITTVLKMTK